MERLPLELWEDILLYVRIEDQHSLTIKSTHRLIGPLPFTHVSSHWRATIKSCPRLWSSIFVDLHAQRPPPGVVSLIELFLRNSGVSPLRLSIAFAEIHSNENPSSQTRLRVLELLFEQLSSCKELALRRFEAFGPLVAAMLSKQQPDLQFPSLRSLSVWRTPYHEDRDDGAKLWDTLKQAPLLQELNINFFSAPSQAGALPNRLTTLIVHVQPHVDHIRSFKDLLMANSQTLAKLMVSCSTELPMPSPHTTVVNIPSLKFFALEPRYLAHDMSVLFGDFQFPNLITLDLILEEKLEVQSEDFPPVFRQCASHISYLSVWFRGLHSQDCLSWLSPLFRHTPNIRELTISMEAGLLPVLSRAPSPTIEVISALGLPTEGTKAFLLPRLQFVQIYDGHITELTPELTGALVDMVESRAPTTSLLEVAFLYCLLAHQGGHYNRDNAPFDSHQCVSVGGSDPSVLQLLERLGNHSRATGARCKVEHADRDNLFSPTYLGEEW
ncbi:hypothetical protein AAF712_011803 [Marasmius tenuissimus]|uniref:F-box domain-containing protein n=1 Tax=Marasmius tenuissimus TaxID=585030 RepID=A0ABR2ZJM6_9AGAR